MAVSVNDLIVGPLTPALGVTTISIDFYFEQAAWLQVYKSGSETPLILNTDYTVTGAGTGSGVVTLTEAADGVSDYTVYLVVPLQRSSDMQTRGGFQSEPFNLEMDRLWQALQRQSTLGLRSFRVGATDTAPAPYVPEPETVMGFDARGETVLYPVNQSVTVAPDPVGVVRFNTVSLVLSDTAMGYTGGASVSVAAGDYVLTTEEGFSYKVAASGASDHHITTAGGVKLYVLPGEQGYNAKAFGAVGDGVTNDATAIQAVLTEGWGIIPEGTYLVNSSLTFSSNVSVVGAGRSKTVLVSGVIGDSLIKPTGDPAFLYLADMELRGNNLTGASGNGHAINLIDAVSAGSTFAPQQVVLERLEIRQFRGQDIRETGVATTICAAGVAMYNCLENVIRNVYVSDCGHGFYAYKTQNCRIHKCAVEDSDKMALFALNNENFVVEVSNLLDAGDGTEDPGYPAGTVAHGSCVLLDQQNQNFVFRNNKIKNIHAGSALIRSLYSDNSVYDANWIRPDAVTNVAHKGFYIERSAGIRITNNTFHPSASGFAQDYQMIEFYSSSNEVTSFTVEGNTFGDVGGQDIAYNIKVGGNSSSRAFQGSIRNNQFGFRNQRSSATTVDADIILSSCSLTDSEIAFNNFYAPTNVTRTVGITASSITDLRNVIGPNKFTAFGGAITAEMSGIRNDRYDAAVIYNPPNLVDGARATTTVTVTGAALKDEVVVSLSISTQGILVYGYVSATDTVTVVFQNNTGGTIDLGSAGLYVTCWRYKGVQV